MLLTLGCVQADVGGADVAADVKPGEIAFRLAEPNDTAIIVPVTIDGKEPYDFVLDVRGLLGLNVLENFRVTLDFERKVMRLEPNTTRSRP